MTEIFDLSKLGAAEHAITAEAIARCEFEWGRLLPGLRAARGKEHIPVEWTDLSRMAGEAKGAHEHAHDEHGDVGHPIIVNAAGEGMPYRKRTLGLAWYSGKVSIDSSLLAQPELAGEVFLAEGAHMLDFFWLTDTQRQELTDVLHGHGTAQGAQTAEHGHTWFDNPSYWSDVGEAFMGLFVLAFSDYPATLSGFEHGTTPAMATQAREYLQPVVYGRARGRTYHTLGHATLTPLPRIWRSAEAAEAQGRRYCYFCNRRRARATL
jgi:hypothetical protein